MDENQHSRYLAAAELRIISQFVSLFIFLVNLHIVVAIVINAKRNGKRYIWDGIFRSIFFFMIFTHIHMFCYCYVIVKDV